MIQQPQENKEEKFRLGITLGDFNGIGAEVIIKTFLDARMFQSCTPIIYGSSGVISFYRKALNAMEFNFNTIRSIDRSILRKINVLNCWEEEVKIESGKATEASAKYALRALDAATTDLQAGRLDALVTAPLSKQTVQQIQPDFTGHTEYLAGKFKAQEYLMFLVSDNMRVGTVTGHVPLQQVSSLLTADKIASKIRIMSRSLVRDFGISKPRIAVLGLNPHAGDGGLIGKEESEIITPAIRKAFDEGAFVYGPYSADGFFGSGNFSGFDGVLAMYHDQGLIPFKALSFTSGVNYTAGLPVVRTSPDHGTAFDKAGKNEASEASFREAVYLAQDIYQHRLLHAQASSNPLAFGFSKLEADQ